MTDSTMPRVSVVVVHHDDDVIERCVASVLDNEPPGEVEVVVVKNNARPRDAAMDAIAARAGAKVVDAGANLGFCGGCNLGVRASRGSILFFLNPDAIAGPGAATACADVLDGDPTIGIVMARVRLLSEPERLNSSGNVLHASGLAWCGGYGDPADTVREVTDVAYPSGAAMAVRRDLYDHFGGMTDELFLYHDDLELGWKARLGGYRCVVTPSADVFHDYEFSRNARKLYWVERNRNVFVLTAYSARLLVLLTPVLVATELAMWLLAWRHGWLRQKLQGWSWILQHRVWVRAHRRETQAIRVVSDRDLARWLSTSLDPQMVDVPGVAAIANPLITAYWGVVRRLL